MLKQLDEACHNADHEAIRSQLMKMVREYSPSSEIADFLWLEGGQMSEESSRYVAEATT
jgi:hypothetical protein